MKKALIIGNMLFAPTIVFGTSENQSLEEFENCNTRQTAISQNQAMARKQLWNAVKSNNFQKIPKIIRKYEDMSAIRDFLLAGANKIEMSQNQIEQYRKRIFQNSHVAELANLSDKQGLTLLLETSAYGNEKIVEYLVEHGANIDGASNNEWTPLGIASAYGNEKIVKYLVDHGADVDKEMEDGITPLLIATQNGHKDIVEYLVEHGADINKASEMNRSTPLSIAAQNRHKDIIEYLVEHGADVNKERKDGCTPLLIATKKGYEYIVEYLVKHGADVNKANNDGVTPVSIAAEEEFENIIKYLEKHGADINKADKDGVTPLFMATQTGNVNIIKYLVEHGADTNKQNLKGNIPLHVAGEKGYENIVKYLVEHGADINKQNNNGLTPLDIAKRMKNEKIVEYLEGENKKSNDFKNALKQGDLSSVENLIQRGARVNKEWEDGDTPLSIAICNENLDLIKYLVEHGANINQKYGKDDDTPLHDAVIMGNKNIVKYLVRKGAHVNRKNYQEKTPIDIAEDLCKQIPEFDRNIIEILYSPRAKRVICKYYSTLRSIAKM